MPDGSPTSNIPLALSQLESRQPIYPPFNQFRVDTAKLVTEGAQNGGSNAPVNIMTAQQFPEQVVAQDLAMLQRVDHRISLATNNGSFRLGMLQNVGDRVDARVDMAIAALPLEAQAQAEALKTAAQGNTLANVTPPTLQWARPAPPKPV